MTIPADVSNANLNSSGDDPRLARADLNTLVLNFNTLLSHLRSNTFTAGSVGDGFGLSGSTVSVDITSTDTITIDCGTLV